MIPVRRASFSGIYIRCLKCSNPRSSRWHSDRLVFTFVSAAIRRSPFCKAWEIRWYTVSEALAFLYSACSSGSSNKEIFSSKLSSLANWLLSSRPVLILTLFSRTRKRFDSLSSVILVGISWLRRDNASGLAASLPGRYRRSNSNSVRRSAYRICRSLRYCALPKYRKFLWSVTIVNRDTIFSSGLYSRRACTIANSSLS